MTPDRLELAASQLAFGNRARARLRLPAATVLALYPVGAGRPQPDEVIAYAAVTVDGGHEVLAVYTDRLELDLIWPADQAPSAVGRAAELAGWPVGIDPVSAASGRLF